LLWLAEAGVFTIERLRKEHLANWQEMLAERLNGQGRLLKARSVNKKIEVVKGFLSYLVEDGSLPGSFATAVRYIKEPHLLPGGVLTHKLIRQLLDAIPIDSAEGYRDRTMLELLYSSGVRSAEILGLDHPDLDLEARTALVLGKGRKQRMVPFGETACRYLRAYIKTIRPHLVSSESGAALFLDHEGKRYPYYSLRRIVHRYSENAGITVNVTPHTFRRSCTTELLRSGANMYHVKELLGHENLDTLKHYARLTITDLKETHRRCHPRDRAGDE
jgi:integrase/recombinase XerD